MRWNAYVSKIVLLLLLLIVASPGASYAEHNEPPTVALVLSGGAAWGAAHIGVIEVLVEQGIEFDMIAGASAGAVAGVFFLDGYSVEGLRSEFAKISLLEVLRPSLGGLGIFQTEPVVDYLESRLHHERIEDLPKPVSITVTDVDTGEAVHLCQGPLARLLAASSAVPIVLNPVKYDGRLFADGGIANNLPVDAAREMGADCIIAVNVAASFSFAGRPEGKAEYANRLYNIMRQSMYDSVDADIYIEPDLTGISGTDFDAYPEMIAIGRQAAAEALENAEQQGLSCIFP